MSESVISFVVDRLSSHEHGVILVVGNYLCTTLSRMILHIVIVVVFIDRTHATLLFESIFVHFVLELFSFLQYLVYVETTQLALYYLVLLPQIRLSFIIYLGQTYAVPQIHRHVVKRPTPFAQLP